MLIRELTFAAIGTGFTCLATVLGAAMVFFFREDLKPATQKIFLGFAAGVMVAASVWSLLIPSMEMAESIVCAAGAGIGFLVAMVLFSGVRRRVEEAVTPKCFEGLPITLVAAAVTSLSFMGFGGIVESIFGA